MSKYKNQLALFDPGRYVNKSVGVVGVGSIGSFSSILLAKMGVRNLLLYDDDTIEEHNIPNQFYKNSQLGEKKTEALRDILQEFTDCTTIECRGNVVEDTLLYNDIILACADSMAARKLTYQNSLELVGHLLDARMNGNTYRLYTIDLKDEAQREYYEQTLYTDEEADNGPCTEKSIVYNVADVAAKIANQVKKILNGEPYHKLLTHDFINDTLIKGK